VLSPAISLVTFVPFALLHVTFLLRWRVLPFVPVKMLELVSICYEVIGGTNWCLR
jgi:hypothetical protein